MIAVQLVTKEHITLPRFRPTICGSTNIWLSPAPVGPELYADDRLDAFLKIDEDCTRFSPDPFAQYL